MSEAGAMYSYYKYISYTKRSFRKKNIFYDVFSSVLLMSTYILYLTVNRLLHKYINL